ncbi:MAG: prolipoprotein diacylglyceryl transferase family protein [Cyanobacteria bacterium J06632_22]
MDFPVWISLGPWRIHPHFVFESLAYTVALRLTLRSSRRSSLLASQQTSVIVGGMVGALAGAKLLVMLQHVYLAWESPLQYGLLLLQGKTVVGALLGAIAGVEITKKLIGVRQSTGDMFVWSLLLGMMIGRVGCFLTGLSDRTYGTVTQLPWGVDFGDGLARHPTQLYEVLFLALLGLTLYFWHRSIPIPHTDDGQPSPQTGEQFRRFMVGYLTFRLFVDAIKPDFHPLLGLSAIQFACILGLVYYWQTVRGIGQGLYGVVTKS